MTETMRERVRRRIEALRVDTPIIEIESLSRELAAELDEKSVSAEIMISRLIVHECARLGVIMRFGSTPVRVELRPQHDWPMPAGTDPKLQQTG